MVATPKSFLNPFLFLIRLLIAILVATQPFLGSPNIFHGLTTRLMLKVSFPKGFALYGLGLIMSHQSQFT